MKHILLRLTLDRNFQLPLGSSIDSIVATLWAGAMIAESWSQAL